MCVEKERESFYRLVPPEAEERVELSKEWMKQAMEKVWNVILAHYVIGLGFVHHEITATKACHMFQIIMNKE